MNYKKQILNLIQRTINRTYNDELIELLSEAKTFAAKNNFETMYDLLEKHQKNPEINSLLKKIDKLEQKFCE